MLQQPVSAQPKARVSPSLLGLLNAPTTPQMHASNGGNSSKTPISTITLTTQSSEFGQAAMKEAQDRTKKTMDLLSNLKSIISNKETAPGLVTRPTAHELPTSMIKQAPLIATGLPPSQAAVSHPLLVQPRAQIQMATDQRVHMVPTSLPIKSLQTSSKISPHLLKTNNFCYQPSTSTNCLTAYTSGQLSGEEASARVPHQLVLTKTSDPRLPEVGPSASSLERFRILPIGQARTSLPGAAVAAAQSKQADDLRLDQLDSNSSASSFSSFKGEVLKFSNLVDSDGQPRLPLLNTNADSSPSNLSLQGPSREDSNPLQLDTLRSLLQSKSSRLQKKKKQIELCDRARRRFTHTEVEFLEAQYLKMKGQWSQEFRKELARMLRVNETKIYKWSWDRRIKDTKASLTA